MKTIAISALALALSAFGARAQTTSNSPDTSAAKPAAPGAAVGEDKGMTGTASKDSAPVAGTAPKVEAPVAGSAATAPSASASDTDQAKPVKKVKKLRRKAQGRSDTSSMHREPAAPIDSTSGSVQRPAAPGTGGGPGEIAAPSGSSPTKDPGISSKPGDVTGQPTDTQKPADAQKPIDDQPAKPQPNK